MGEREKNGWISERSAGGVVVRDQGQSFSFLAIQPAGHDRWQLPKGRIDKGETAEQAALREVREEGGVTARIEHNLPPIRYFFHHKGKKIAKIVAYFVMRYEQGETADHDDEVSQAVWFPLDEPEHLTFGNEQDLVRRSAELIREQSYSEVRT